MSTTRLNLNVFQGYDHERWTTFRKMCKDSNSIGCDDYEARAENRAMLVDQLIRDHKLQVSHSVRPNLRPIAAVGSHRSMTDAFGNFMVLVTDGLQCWVLLADGRITILHWTNVIVASDVKEEVSVKPKKKKPLTKTQLALIESLKELGILDND